MASILAYRKLFVIFIVAHSLILEVILNSC